MVIDVFFNTAMTDNPDGQDVNIQQGAAAYITDENIVKAVNHCILVDGKTIREINQAAATIPPWSALRTRPRAYRFGSNMPGQGWNTAAAMRSSSKPVCAM